LISKAERVLRERCLRVSLDRLSEKQSRTLVQEVLESADLPPKLRGLLQPFSGHPLALEEALRFLVERGWLWRSADRWRLSEFEHSVDRRLPDNFKDLALGRLDALESGTLHVLQAAAVLGENFDEGVLSQIVSDPGLHPRLAELVDRGWLLDESTTDRLRYRFKHTLTRETIYATLLASKRQLLHQRAGEALESLSPAAREEQVELLAHHFGHSALRDRSLHYLARAGQKSLARYALGESLSFYQQAQEALAYVTNPTVRLAANVNLGLADVYLELGEPSAAVERLSAVLSSEAQVPPSEVRAGCLRRLGAANRDLGEYPAALGRYQAAREALTSQGESTAQPFAPASGPREEELLEISLGEA